jgi:hypothetical protein
LRAAFSTAPLRVHLDRVEVVTRVLIAEEGGSVEDRGYPLTGGGVRGVVASRLLVCCAVALLILLALAAEPALAQQTQTPQSVGGGEVGYIDWFYHLPLALGCALLVVAVDAFVILRYVRRKGEA